jgi:hypothetical protein
MPRAYLPAKKSLLTFDLEQGSGMDAQALRFPAPLHFAGIREPGSVFFERLRK